MDIQPLYCLRAKKITRPALMDVEEHLRREAGRFAGFNDIFGGDRVAIAVGSRGIDRLPEIVSAMVRIIKEAGGRPFIVPAMGSHGGATAGGQEAVLSRLGVTSGTTGAPVCSSMETVCLGHTAEGIPVYCDKTATEADKVVIINRVKPHTSFSGEIESGLLKMLAVGLGNDTGCRAVHAAGLERAVVPVGRFVLRTLPLVTAVAILENENGEVCDINLVDPENLEEREKALLVQARKMAPKLPFKMIDLLIVQEMGKNISGTGMDSRVIGRVNRCGVEADAPEIDKIVVLDLSGESGGNAWGMGMADVVTRTLVDKIDYTATYENALSTRFLDRAKIPVIMPDDRSAILFALRTLHNRDLDAVKILMIKNTLDLKIMWASKSLLAEAGAKGFAISPEPEELRFDGCGKLLM